MLYIICEGRCNPKLAEYDALCLDHLAVRGAPEGIPLLDQIRLEARRLRHTPHKRLRRWAQGVRCTVPVCMVCGTVRRW